MRYALGLVVLYFNGKHESRPLQLVLRLVQR